MTDEVKPKTQAGKRAVAAVLARREAAERARLEQLHRGLDLVRAATRQSARSVDL